MVSRRRKLQCIIAVSSSLLAGYPLPLVPVLQEEQQLLAMHNAEHASAGMHQSRCDPGEPASDPSSIHHEWKIMFVNSR